MTDLAEITLTFDRFLRRLHRQMPARAEAAGVAFVPPPAGLVLFALDETGPVPKPMPMQELARTLARDKSQITRLVRDLEAKGLVARSPYPDDARVCLVALTDAGARRVAQMHRVMRGVLSELLTPLDAAERTSLRAILNKL